MMALFEALKETMLTAQLRMHGKGKAKGEEETRAQEKAEE